MDGAYRQRRGILGGNLARRQSDKWRSLRSVHRTSSEMPRFVTPDGQI
jgi:hypothetical protein